MTVVELFAGAGGASLGLVAAGFTELRAVEWNADACATRRAAGLRCDEGDVRDPAHYAGVTADAVWSSFPCQAWSTAGKRLGKDDPRNGWPWTVDVLDQVRPTWFMGENVPGLTYHRGGCNGRCADDCARLYLESVILPQLQERFAWVGWRILDAARFGVPQRRERLILVAGPRPVVWPHETHAPPEELRQGGMFGEARKPWVTVRQALGLTGTIWQGGIGGCGLPQNLSLSPAPSIVAKATATILEDSKPAGLRDDPIPLDIPAPTIRAQGARDKTGHQGGHAAPRVDTRAGSRPELLDRPSPTVTTCEVKGTRGEGQHGGPDRASDAAWLGAGIRRLTPAECATLQDFPPDHPWRGTKTSIYAQIGNSVCRTVARLVATSVLRATRLR